MDSDINGVRRIFVLDRSRSCTNTTQSRVRSRQQGMELTEGGESPGQLGGLSADGIRALLGFTRALTGDGGLAEDIVQDIVCVS